jgi:chromosome segregation ATPase
MDLEQEHLRERDRALQDRSYELETALAEMETEVTRLREQVAIQAEDQEALEAQTGRLDDQVAQLEADVEAQRRAMEAATETIQADLGDATASLNRELEDLQDELGDFIASLAPQVEETREELTGVYGQLGELEGRLALLQAAQDLVKVRLLLVEDNPGTARNTLALAITHVEQASALMPRQAETLVELQTQMTALDGLIAQRSFRARPDLETIWASLMDLVVPAPLTTTLGVTATQTTSPLPTPTSSP